MQPKLTRVTITGADDEVDPHGAAEFGRGYFASTEG